MNQKIIKVISRLNISPSKKKDGRLIMNKASYSLPWKRRVALCSILRGHSALMNASDLDELVSLPSHSRLKYDTKIRPLDHNVPSY